MHDRAGLRLRIAAFFAALAMGGSAILALGGLGQARDRDEPPLGRGFRHRRNRKGSIRHGRYEPVQGESGGTAVLAYRYHGPAART